jgi:hypothetical protein
MRYDMARCGLVRSALYTQNLTRIAKYTIELYRRLEAENGAGHRAGSTWLYLDRDKRGAMGGIASQRRDAACV